MDLALKQSDGHCDDVDPVTLEPKEEVGTRVRVWLVLNRQCLLYQIYILPSYFDNIIIYIDLSHECLIEFFIFHFFYLDLFEEFLTSNPSKFKSDPNPIYFYNQSYNS